MCPALAFSFKTQLIPASILHFDVGFNPTDLAIMSALTKDKSTPNTQSTYGFDLIIASAESPHRFHAFIPIEAGTSKPDK